MRERIVAVVLSGFLLVNLYGCLAIVAGGAGGAGTALWLSDKLTQQFDVPYDRAVSAALYAVKSLNLPVNKETKEAEITQIKSTYNGKEVWIDVRKTGERSSKVEVRVGIIKPDKEGALRILKRIEHYI